MTRRAIRLSAALLAIGILLLPTTAHAAGGEVVVIELDRGGSVAQFDARARRWAREGTRVIIDGACASSCTRYTYLKWHLDICATPRADLLFHKPFQMAVDSRKILRSPAAVADADRMWREDWLGNMTTRQRSLFRNVAVPSSAATGDTREVISARHHMADFVKACPASLIQMTIGTHVVTVDGTSDALDPPGTTRI